MIQMAHADHYCTPSQLQLVKKKIFITMLTIASLLLERHAKGVAHVYYTCGSDCASDCASDNECVMTASAHQYAPRHSAHRISPLLIMSKPFPNAFSALSTSIRLEQKTRKCLIANQGTIHHWCGFPASTCPDRRLDGQAPNSTVHKDGNGHSGLSECCTTTDRRET